MKIALVHDDLVQWGGAERVLLAISEMFPEAPIYTSVFDKDNLTLSEKFLNKTIRTSFMQQIPGWKLVYKQLLPLYPIAFEQFDFSQFDLVISQTTRFAKNIITKPQTRHVCFIHTPPRFLWNYSGEQASKFWQPYLSYLRIYDRMTASRVDTWLAGSINCQRRLQKTYQVESKVLYPFVDDGFLNDEPIFDGDYYLMVARLNAYKKVDLAIEVFNKLKKRLIVIGDGPQLGHLRTMANSNIEFYQSVSESVLIQLMRGCRGVVVTADEDFGLVSLEAQAMGKAVVAYNSGGLQETVIENKTGIFFNEQTVSSLIEAVEKFEQQRFNPKHSRENADRFTKKRFKDSLRRLLF